MLRLAVSHEWLQWGDRVECLLIYMTPMVGLDELSVPTPMLVY